jgi:serine/threonine protein kinase
MAALFRIVQDDYPPLPEGISQALRDFLLLCFQKEPTMRKGAERLLEHPWLQNTSNAAVHTSDLLPSKDGIPDEVVVNTIRKFQLDMKTKPTKKTGQPTSTKSPASGNKTGRNDLSQPAAPPNRPKQSADNSPPSSTSSKAIPKQKQPVEDDDDENWDFDEPTVKLSLSGGTSHQAKQPTSQTASTTKIKLPLNQNNQSNQQNKGDLKINNAQLSSIMTDENWEDEMDAAETPPRQQPKPRGHARVNTHVSVSSLVPNLSKYQDTADDADLGDINLDESIPAPQQQGTRRNQGTLSSKDSETSKSSPNANMSRVLHQRMKQNVNEENIDTFDDLEVDEHYFQQNETRDVDMRRSREIVQLMASIKPDSTERDVIEKCNQLLQTFEKHPEQREHLITHHGVLPVLDMLEARSGLRPNIPVLDMLEARSGTIRPHVLRVINKIVEGSIRAQEQLSLVGLIPIVMRLLEYSPNKGRLGSTEPQGVDPVVLEAGRFVHQISSTSSLTLQMLIGAGGLPVLVHMVAFSNQMCNNSTSINANDAKQMVYMGLDCIIEVFSVKSSRTRDFCKLFVKLGILPHLSLAFQYIMGMSPPASATNSQKSHLGVEPGIVTEVNRDNYEPERWQYGLRIANIFWIFSRYEVTEQMSKDGVLEVMMGALKHSSLTSPIDKFRHLYDHDEAKSIVPNEYAEIAELLLKSIKNFTMEPTALNDLEQVGAIGTLIDLLDGPIRDRCKNHILPSLYNLCRIEVRRLDSAAKEGIIPHLQRIILEGSHLKQFALPILCDLVRASHAAREELWRNDGVVFYINLLDEKYWQTFALNSLTYWCASSLPHPLLTPRRLYHDSRVEGVLIEPSNVAKLVGKLDLTSHAPLLHASPLIISRILPQCLSSNH